VVSRSDIVVVARVESPDVLGFSVRVGYRRPLTQTASGRVLFAFQSEAGRAAMRTLAASEPDAALFATLEKEAAQVREMGFYLSPSAYVDAVTDIAAPVTADDASIAVAALVMPFIGGRSARISLTQAAAATREAALRISRALA
jgi:DNA-binding IclR family transcriptional regulator